MPIQSINPHTLLTNRTFQESTPEECLRIIDITIAEQNIWATRPVVDRTQLAETLATQLLLNLDFHAKTITSEMGKPITEARAEVEKCAGLCRYYSLHSDSFLSDRTIETDYSESLVRYEPLGVILAIMPWNFPYWQVFRAAIPALMAGNALILKHASNTTTCALNIEAVFQEAGFPVNLFRAVPVRGENANVLIRHPGIAAITFTGSNAAGENIATLAGAHLKKTVLELGGSDPSIVLDDTDLELASTKCVSGRMLNAGQSCISSKRILLHQSIAEPFLKLVRQKIQDINVGDPMLPSTQMGPLATLTLSDEIHRQVTESVKMGANCILGGHPMDGPGYYYSPTLLTKVTQDMPVWTEETFGPVMCVTLFSDENKAIELANHTQWGLGCSVYSRDIERALKIGKKIQAGTCAINDFVKSDSRMPFGGVKKSGYGRELGTEGIREFTNVKAYNILK